MIEDGAAGIPSGGVAGLHVRPRNLKTRLRAVLLAGAGLLAVASSGYFGWHYWTVGRFNISTDNAYVKADNITIAPKVSGYIGTVLVGDNNEQVRAGQVSAHRRPRFRRRPAAGRRWSSAAARAAEATKRAALAGPAVAHPGCPRYHRRRRG